MMEMETLNRKSLLYGCRTGQWFVNLFNVIENQRESETGQTKYVFNEMCVGNLIFMLLKTTNRISVNYLKMDYFGLGFSVERLGRFWDKNTEIDIFGYTKEGNTVAGEIKWTGFEVVPRAIQNFPNKRFFIESIVRGKIE